VDFHKKLPLKTKLDGYIPEPPKRNISTNLVTSTNNLQYRFNILPSNVKAITKLKDPSLLKLSKETYKQKCEKVHYNTIRSILIGDQTNYTSKTVGFVP